MMHYVDRLARRLHAVIGRGKITAVKDGGVVMKAQVDIGPMGDAGPLSVQDDRPFVQQFGLASQPPLGTDIVMVFPGGERSNGVIVASNHKDSRPRDLGAGDAALHDLRGQRVWLTAGGIIIEGAGLPMTIRNVASLTVEGPTHVSGSDLTVDGYALVKGDATVQGNAHVEGNATVDGTITSPSLAG